MSIGALVLACTVYVAMPECGPECAALRPEIEQAQSIAAFVSLTERASKAPGADYILQDAIEAWAKGNDGRIAALVATRLPPLANAAMHVRGEEDHTQSTAAMIALLADRTTDTYTRWSAASHLSEDQPVNPCFVDVARQVASDVSDPAADDVADLVVHLLSDDELRAADRGALRKVAVLQRARKGDRTVSVGVSALMLDTSERVEIRERAIGAAGELGAVDALATMLDERYWFEGARHACTTQHSVQSVISALWHARDTRTLELLEHIPLEKLPEGTRGAVEGSINAIRLMERLRRQAH